jgi:RNA recognition motif-containing protein
MTSTSSPQQATQEGTNDTIYIGNLPPQYATEVIIEKLLQRYGRVERVSIVRPNDRTAYAFGQFATAEQATVARQALHGRKLGGRTLQVRPAEARSSQTATANHLTSTETATQRQLDHRIRAIQEKLHQKHPTYDKPSPT